MIDGVNAKYSLTTKSVDAYQKQTTRTISDILEPVGLAAVEDEDATTATKIDTIMRALYGLSLNTYSDSTFNLKESVNEMVDMG